LGFVEGDGVPVGELAVLRIGVGEHDLGARVGAGGDVASGQSRARIVARVPLRTPRR
jgi:hypothetical protein